MTELVERLRYGVHDVETGEPLDPGAYAHVTAEDVREAIAALSAEPQAASPSDPAPMPVVKVKPLEWRGPSAGFYEADALGGVIQIMDGLRRNDPGNWVLYPVETRRRKFDTLDAAKAAAQADYERRILSALDLSPAPQEERKVEAWRPEGDTEKLGGAGLGDLLARDLRVVTLDFRSGTPNEHIVHKDHVPVLVEASVKLHFDPGKNPYNGGEASKIWRIRCAEYRAYGPYWWAQKELGVTSSEGAFTIHGNAGETVWLDESYDPDRDYTSPVSAVPDDGAVGSVWDIVTEIMSSHICPEHGMMIGEGGCPRINWYKLRNELVTALNTKPARAPEWRTMDSAPKDGTLILVWDRYVDGLADPVVASWTDGDGTFEWHHWRGSGVLYDPQYWMPLPASPQGERAAPDEGGRDGNR